MRLLHPAFRYVHSTQTDVMSTWMRFGFRPVSDEERTRRLEAFAGKRPQLGSDRDRASANVRAMPPAP